MNLNEFDIDLDEIEDLPSYEIWPTGQYTNISVVAELKEIDEETEIFELKCTISEDTEIEIRNEEDTEPKPGDVTQIAYFIKSSTGNAKGLQMLKRDWAEQFPQLDNMKDIAEMLIEGVEINAEFVKRKGNKPGDDGEPKYFQNIKNIEVI